mmetsp:Transcript_54462/g.88213  ORF Transcript_54462/g.88213 Transcript_54462/m.88213 type:complete len:1184 (+) Transcript_54462:4197-7748(+)
MDQDLVLAYMNDGNVHEALRLSCWDYGGQDTFYGLHNLYIGRKSVYVIVFNMQWFLPDVDTGKLKFHLGFLVFWLNTIAANAVDPSDGSVAPIVLVGTHKDVVGSAEQHQHISKLLILTFSNTSVWAYVHQFQKESLAFFPIDNSMGSKDPVMLHVKEVVHKAVMAEKYIQEKVPFVWLKVLQHLHGEVSKGKSVLKLDQVVDICNEFGMETAIDDTRLLFMLKLFSDFGQLMHHSEEKLRFWVILDPANFLVTPATRIICQHDMHGSLNEFIQTASKQESQLYANLLQGILYVKLLDILWHDRLEHSEILQDLLVKFGFFIPVVGPVGQVAAGGADRYLVPALLPQVLPHKLDTQQCAGAQLVGYLVFAHDAAMQKIRKQGYIAVDKVKTEGFFPKGLFCGTIGHIVDECQSVHNMTVEDMELGLNEISAAFGRHNFSLRVNEEVQAMELVIKVDSPLLISERILELIGKAVAQTMPSLQFALAVDQSGGLCQNGIVQKPEGHLVIIDGHGGLQKKLDENVREISIGSCNRWSATQARKHYEKWLRPTGLRQGGYDIFISYRWTDFDTELVMAVYSILCHKLIGIRQVQVFVDRFRLEDGRRFDKDFSKALMKSTVVAPVVSLAALQRMLTLTTDSDVDNVLLEWMLICELVEIGHLLYCLPIMLGNATDAMQPDGKFISNLFAEGVIAKLPDVVCEKVVAFVKKLLEDNGKTPSTLLHTRTVRGTVETLTKALGVLTWDITSSHGAGANCKRSASHTRAEFRQALFYEVVEKAMGCVETAEYHGKSKVDNPKSLGCIETAESDEKFKVGDPKYPVEACHEIDDWLSSICLQEYTTVIKEYGYDSFKSLDAASEEEMLAMMQDDDLAMKKPHRSLLMKEWKLRVAGQDACEDGHKEETHADVYHKSDGKTETQKAVRPQEEEITQEEQAPQQWTMDAGNTHADAYHESDCKEVTQKEASHPQPMMEEEESKQEAQAPQQWTMDVHTCAQMLAAALEQGGKALNSSRLNIVGQGRGGKTCLLRGISNLPFQDTASTIGVQQSLLEIDKVDINTSAGGGWCVVEDGSNSIMNAEEAQTRLAAQIALQETPQDRLLRQAKRLQPHTFLAPFLGDSFDVVGAAIPGIAVLGLALNGLSDTAKRAKYNKEVACAMQCIVDMIAKNILPSLVPNLRRAAKVRIKQVRY